MSEVTDLLDAIRDGRMTLEEVSQRFREHDWPRKNKPAPSNYEELATAAQEKPSRT
jgi:hypothetical protein